MTKLLKLTDAPFLPYDVLRLIFEEATRGDRRKAGKYALISKLVSAWYAVSGFACYELNPECLNSLGLRVAYTPTSSFIQENRCEDSYGRSSHPPSQDSFSLLM